MFAGFPLSGGSCLTKNTFDVKGVLTLNANGRMHFYPGSAPVLDACVVTVGGKSILNAG